MLISACLQGNLANQQKVVVVDPVRDSVESALKQRLSEYSSQNQYLLVAGTFNVNGKVPGNESLLPWLFPDTGERSLADAFHGLRLTGTYRR
jgi:hypothetical protein